MYTCLRGSSYCPARLVAKSCAYVCRWIVTTIKAAGIFSAVESMYRCGCLYLAAVVTCSEMRCLVGSVC